MKVISEAISEKYPEFPLPSWLPPEVQDFVYQHAESIENLKDADIGLAFANYEANVQYLKRVMPAFTYDSMKGLWQLLSNKSAQTAKSFAWHLIAIEYNAGFHIKNHERNQEKQKAHLKMIKNTEKLLGLVHDFNKNFRGELISDSTKSIEKLLRDFVTEEKSVNGKYRKSIENINYLNSEHIILSRELYSEKALPLRFLKMINLFFRRELGKPYHNHNLSIVGSVFDVYYNENFVAKITENIADILKPEDCTT